MSLSKEAFTRIHDAIVSGALDFGERLSEMQIAEALGMSKAPVRTAFFELRDIRLVTIVPQAGTYVFSPTREEVREMSIFRAMLETAGMRLSMENDATALLTGLKETVGHMEHAMADGEWKKYESADMGFHRLLINHSGNSYLPQAYNLTASTIEALRVRLQGGTGDYRKQSFGEHQLILSQLEARNLDAASRTLEDHIMVINNSRLELPAQGAARSKARTRTLEAYKLLFG